MTDARAQPLDELHAFLTADLFLANCASSFSGQCSISKDEKAMTIPSGMRKGWERCGDGWCDVAWSGGGRELVNHGRTTVVGLSQLDDTMDVTIDSVCRRYGGV